MENCQSNFGGGNEDVLECEGRLTTLSVGREAARRTPKNEMSKPHY
jgi:hypothetical protein